MMPEAGRDALGNAIVVPDRDIVEALRDRGGCDYRVRCRAASMISAMREALRQMVAYTAIYGEEAGEYAYRVLDECQSIEHPPANPSVPRSDPIAGAAEAIASLPDPSFSDVMRVLIPMVESEVRHWKDHHDFACRALEEQSPQLRALEKENAELRAKVRPVLRFWLSGGGVVHATYGDGMRLLCGRKAESRNDLPSLWARCSEHVWDSPGKALRRCKRCEEALA